VLTVAALLYLLPNVAYIEQTLDINATPDKVFALINRPDNWIEWYSPVMDSAGVTLSYTATSEGRGAGMNWTGKSSNKSNGTMNITGSKNNRKVAAIVTINDKRTSVMNFRIKPVGIDASTLKITSHIRFRQDSILHFIKLMFDRSDELAIIDYLENIEIAAIGKPDVTDVNLHRMEAFSYICINDSCDVNVFLPRMRNLYSELMIYGAKSGIDMTASPIVIYHRIDSKWAVFEIGVPVAEDIRVSGRIQHKIMPEGDYVVANYFGAYDTLEDGHNAIKQWLIRYRQKQTGYAWEMYVTGPAAEPDSNKWQTRIFYPID
jgi:effector-binding domain-containing protein